uniref:Uncharacterized protein n=1 Tax=Brassica oleracea var. oleracea TaxID=109376 RepID=A0A0D3BCX6_BRAOL
MKEKTEAQDSPLAQGLEDPPLSDRCHETRGWRNRLRASRDQLSLSLLISRKLCSTKGDSTSPSVTLLGGVSFGVSHRRRRLRLLVISLRGTSPPSFPSVAQIEAFTSDRKIMRACIILHNMIVEDERDGYSLVDVSEFQHGEDHGNSHVDFTYSTDIPSNITNMMDARSRIRNRQMHQQLKDDLVEHIWHRFGHGDDNN